MPKLVLFDIDGTLAPIVERPDEARLPDAVQDGLAELSRRYDIAVITGRSVEDARRMLSFTPRYVVGNHGIEGLPGASVRLALAGLPASQGCRRDSLQARGDARRGRAPGARSPRPHRGTAA